MLDRVETARNDSDTALFLALLYSGELVLKLAAAALLAAVADDRERNAKRVAQRLVRSDGLGGWVEALTDLLSGPASRYLVRESIADRNSLTEKHGRDSRQFEAVSLLAEALEVVGARASPIGSKIALRQWFIDLVTLRNRTRAHGATGPGTFRKAAPALERSLRLMGSELPLFLRPWGYVYKDLGGRRHLHSRWRPGACLVGPRGSHRRCLR